MSRERQPWVLTGDTWAALLRHLDPDPDRAAAEYERLRLRLTKLFRWRGCTCAEEYTDITLDRVARLLSEGAVVQTTNPFALFYGVALNLLREHWRRVERERRGLDGMRSDPSRGESADEVLSRVEAERAEDLRRRCLQRCLMRLAPQSRALITRYYAGGPVLDKNQRKAVAAELQVTVNTLRVRAHRVRTEVGACVERCLERASP